MNKKGNVPVIYIITKLELGGAQKVCLSLFEKLEKKDHPTFLISGTEGPLVKTIQNHPHVFLISSLVRECSFKTIKQEFKAFWHMVKIIRTLLEEYPDMIVHTHSTKAGYLGRFAGWFAGASQRIHTIHGFGFHPYQSRIAYTIAYLCELFTSLITTHYICVSTKDQATGEKCLPWFSKKNSLIRAAINEHEFVPAFALRKNYETPHFIFGTVSCFKKQKNLFDLLTAFKEVHERHPRARLELIGDGILRPAIEQWIIEHNLDNNILLHGWQDNVAKFMANWHVFVMSSLWEGLPCAAVEARFLKLPVLSYNVGGISDLIISGKNGFLYEPRNIQQLAQGMDQLMTNKELFVQLKMYNEDLSTFTNSAMILQHSILYRSLATRK